MLSVTGKIASQNRQLRKWSCEGAYGSLNPRRDPEQPGRFIRLLPGGERELHQLLCSAN